MESLDVKDQLAPGGRLRVGVYAGSPLSMVRGADAVEAHGVSLDLGREFARRLGAQFELITCARLQDVLAAVKAGTVDFTVTNASPARAQDMSFSQTLLSLEVGYLVPAGSRIAALGDVDRTGLRVGVTQNSTSERTLPKLLGHATVVPAPSLNDAICMLADDRLDAFATSKPILFEMSDQLPGSRILDGHWNLEHVAVAIPKGREAALDAVRRFVAEVRSNGVLTATVERAGLRGAVGAS